MALGCMVLSFQKRGEEKASHAAPDIYSSTNPNARPSRKEQGKTQAVLHS